MTFAAAANAKALAWSAIGVVVAIAQTGAALFGRIRRVDTLVYKVDRLGDWVFAEPSIERIARAMRAHGRILVVWASQESTPLRGQRRPDWSTETVQFEPRGWWARCRRTFAVIRLVTIYRAETVVSLRHGPDPVRDFVLRTVRARNLHALSWVIRSNGADEIPHEIRRHAWILASMGLAPGSSRELLPRASVSWHPRGGRVIIAPFSSAAVKDWPDQAWAAVVSAFDGRPLRWELWAGPEQRARAERVRAKILTLAPRADVLIPTGSLHDLAAAVSDADLVLSVDTLAAHLACAADAPLIALLGGGQFGDFAPWSRSTRQRWLSHPLPCFGCNWHCTRPENDCVRLIPPPAVIALARELLELASRPAPGISTPSPGPLPALA